MKVVRVEGDEEWRMVRGYPDYAISNKGNLLDMLANRPIRPTFVGSSERAYARITTPYQGDPYVRVRIEDLVAQAFIFNGRWKLYPVRHKNGDFKDNRVENLMVLDHDGGPPKGPLRGKGRDWGRRVMINETGEAFTSVRACAEHIKGDYSSIYAVLRGERQSHMGLTFRILSEEELGN